MTDKKLYTNKINHDPEAKKKYLHKGKVIWEEWHMNPSFSDKDIDYWISTGMIYWANPDAWVVR